MQLNIASSCSHDEIAIRRFYLDNPHPDYAFRDGKLVESASNGDFIFAHQEGHIVGCVGIFQHRAHAGRLLLELGQSRVTLGGHNLFSFLAHMRFLRVYLDYRSADVVFSQFDETNELAINRALQMGHRLFDPDQELIDLATAALPPDKRAHSLGIPTVYTEFSRTNLADVNNYFAGTRKGDRYLISGSSGAADIELAPAVVAMLEACAALCSG